MCEIIFLLLNFGANCAEVKEIFFKKLYMCEGGDEVSCPYTRGLEDIFVEKYGFDLKKCLPEIFFDFGEGKNKVRYYFRRLIGELFYENYFCQIYDWCDSHGIDFTGHILFEETLSPRARLGRPYADVFKASYSRNGSAF